MKQTWRVDYGRVRRAVRSAAITICWADSFSIVLILSICVLYAYIPICDSGLFPYACMRVCLNCLDGPIRATVSKLVSKHD